MYAFVSQLSFGCVVQIVDLYTLAIFLVIWQMKNFGDRSTSVSASVFSRVLYIAMSLAPSQWTRY